MAENLIAGCLGGQVGRRVGVRPEPVGGMKSRLQPANAT